MIITYQFADGKKTEVEVSEEIGAVIVDMNRQDYNNEHKETRRHCSLEAYNLDDSLIPSDVDIEGEYVKNEEYRFLHEAIQKLTPRQRQIIIEVYFNDKTPASIAREEGVHHSTIDIALQRAKKKFKKIFVRPSAFCHFSWPTCEGYKKSALPKVRKTHETRIANRCYQKACERRSRCLPKSIGERKAPSLPAR